MWIITTLGINSATVCQAGYSSITSYVLLAIPLFTIGLGALGKSGRFHRARIRPTMQSSNVQVRPGVTMDKKQVSTEQFADQAYMI